MLLQWKKDFSGLHERVSFPVRTTEKNCFGNLRLGPMGPLDMARPPLGSFASVWANFPEKGSTRLLASCSLGPTPPAGPPHGPGRGS